MDMMNTGLKKVLTFILLTFALSAAPLAVIVSAGSMKAAGMVWVVFVMWSPGLAAIITQLVFHKSLRGLGWGWGKTRYQALGYLLPLVYTSATYALVWLFGLGKISDRLPTGTARFLLIVFIGPVFNMIATTGEEIGWRGFLVPELTKLIGYTGASLISGLIWAVWHYPGILFADYNNPGTPRWYSLLCFTVMIVGISFALSWIRLKSGSLWTAAVFHGSHNCYIQAVFDPLTVGAGITPFIIGEFGAGLALMGLVVAYVFWRKRDELPVLAGPGMPPRNAK
jgi:membrane protease YdiL (CAAX protease family)